MSGSNLSNLTSNPVVAAKITKELHQRIIEHVGPGGHYLSSGDFVRDAIREKLERLEGGAHGS
jgi:Arc/MetJ-type ribon-helix-helix transcriptional regulator